MEFILSFSAPKNESKRIKSRNNVLDIGRESNSCISLDHSSVSRKHAVISVIDEKSHLVIEDHRSANGTYVDGVRLSTRVRLYPDQVIGIGPFKFTICSTPQTYHNTGNCVGAWMSSEVADSIVREAVNSLPDMYVPDEKGKDTSNALVTSRAEKLLYKKILELMPPQMNLNHAAELLEKAVTQSMGLGPLEKWLFDPQVSEIMVNGCEQIYLEIDGKICLQDPVFTEDQELYRIIERILAPIGRRVDESVPYADGRLPDGSRVNIAVPPVSLAGPIITIRKFNRNKLTMNDLVESGSITRRASDFLKRAVLAKRNILISGGTGSGKTTFMNIVAGFIPSSERIITIEDAAELNLHQDHIVSLETRPPNIEGSGEITTRDLVRNSLRMRPDRIIVGECRGEEALDMLQAMNTGHAGSMTTCHANSPRDALKRIETMAMMAGLDIPHAIVREQVASAIHMVVHISRSAEGKRVVRNIMEVDRVESGQILTQDIFKFSTDEKKARLLGTGLRSLFEYDSMENDMAERILIDNS